MVPVNAADTYKLVTISNLKNFKFGCQSIRITQKCFYYFTTSLVS